MDETGWSRRHVTERFRRQLGVSPKAYARLLRFEHATSLLNRPATRCTLADVAMEAGYYDQSHLSRDFVALAGMTPAAYAADATKVPEVRFVQDAATVGSRTVDAMTDDPRPPPPQTAPSSPCSSTRTSRRPTTTWSARSASPRAASTGSTTAPSCTPRCATATPPSGCTG